MRVPILLSVPIVFLLFSSSALARHACISPDQAMRHIHHEVCVEAHVYRVVDATNGIHFLDVCSPETSDADCRFFILSSSRDKTVIAFLHSLAGKNIHIRGKIRPLQGRADMVFSSKQQLHGGREIFQPNPQLLKTFSAESGGQGFSTRNGLGDQHGVHFRHRGN